MCATRILAVDDEEHVRRLLKDALTLRGYEVELAADGVDAAKRLRDEEFDIVVTDLQMPRMDGREVLGLIKSDPTLRRIPVVVLTTSSEEADILGCYEMGANTYISKPVEFAGFLRAATTIGRYWLCVAEIPKT